MGKVIIINGSGGVGKDQFIDFFKQDTTHSTVTFNKSTIEPVKRVAQSMGWDGVKTEKSRKFLSDIKELWINYNNKLFDDLISFCELTKFRVLDVYIFIHCREPKEILKYKKYFGDNFCETLLIRRPKFNISTNSSDNNVEKFKYDHIINNRGGLDYLKILASDFKQKIIKR